MALKNYDDTALLTMQLTQLKSTFEKKLQDGETFINLKKILLQIKDIEYTLFENDPESVRQKFNTPPLPSRHMSLRDPLNARYRHIEEPPPLL
jgi:hypothetical protein